MKSSDRILAQRYAAAYMSAAKNAADAAALAAGLEDLAGRLAYAETALASPLAGVQEKKELMKDIAGRESRALRLAGFMAEAKRFYLLGTVTQEARALADVISGTVRAQAKTARALDEKQRMRLTEKLAALTGKNPVIAFQTAPELLGGMQVRVGDLLIDASVSGRLDRLETILNTD